MGRITSNIGLASGVPIVDTVNQLIKVQSRPRDLLVDQNKRLETEQVSISELAAMLLSVQLSAKNLYRSTIYNQRKVTSSDESLITAVANSGAALGNYQFTPYQVAQSQQLVSTGVASRTDPLDGGRFSFRFGGFIDANSRLDIANGGAGIERGVIRITDRSGASADIDLTRAIDVDDVLTAINSNSQIAVRAEVHGDRLRLVDLSGSTASNLSVQEAGGGSTAASLGLAGINVAADRADGQDIVRLFDKLDLSRLNSGSGIRFDRQLSDLEVNFRDGSDPLQIDFYQTARTGTLATAKTQAANADATVEFEAVKGGSEFVGVQIVFQDDPAVTAGNETVTFDDSNPNDKKLVFRISAGETDANAIVRTLNDDETASQFFRARLPQGGNGFGKIDVSDTAVTAGPPATATTPGADDPNARIVFTAQQPGADFDNVTILFQTNGSIPPGGETVVYDDSDPDNKKLTFQINPLATSANRVIDALNNDPVASQYFKAARAPGADGTGRVVPDDTAITSGGAIVERREATKEARLEDILKTINEADPTRLRAEISADGDRLLLIDLTDDLGGTFSVQSINQSQAAEDLGLVGTPQGGVLSGRRILSGLNTSLLTNLDGGRGLGELGSVELTDRSGASASVDLSAAETLQDVIDAINDAGIGIAARVNDARNGIRLTDTTGQVASNLVVASAADGLETAEKLGIVFDDDQNSLNSGDLRLQVVSQNTKLASLNGGGGVANGSFTLTDSKGISATFTLSSSDTKDVGDLILEINRLSVGVRAQINEAGDGILLVDTAGGDGQLQVSAGSGNTARDLRLLGGVEEREIDGNLTSVVNGSTTFSIDFDGELSLDDLAERINEAALGVKASVFNDGSLANPYRLTLLSERQGSAGQLLLDTSEAGFEFSETAKAQDARVVFGAPGSGGVIATSSTNTFRDLIGGVTLNLHGASNSTVTLTVGSTDTSLITNIESLVDNYNKLQNRIAELTAFDPETGKRGPLLGDNNVLRIQSDLNRVMSGRIAGLGPVQTLGALGIGFNDDNTLTLDKDEFQAAFAEDPTAVADFFRTETSGFAQRLDDTVQQLAAADEALLINRLRALATNVETNDERIERWNQRLEVSRERLLMKFIRMEQAIASFQNNLNAISAIVPLKPLAI